MTTLNDITVRALKMHKADGIRYIAKALKEEQDRLHVLSVAGCAVRGVGMTLAYLLLWRHGILFCPKRYFRILGGNVLAW